MPDLPHRPLPVDPPAGVPGRGRRRRPLNACWQALLLVLQLVLLVGLGLGPAHAAVAPEAAAALMQHSGLWNQFDALSPQVMAGVQGTLAQQGVTPDAKRLERVTQAAAVFAPQRLREQVQTLMAADLQPAHLDALNQWFNGEAAQTLRQLEDTASRSPLAPEDRVRRGGDLLTTLPRARVERLRHFVRSARAAEALTNMTVNMLIAHNLGAAMANPEVESVDVDALRGMVEAQRADMQAQLEPVAAALFANTFAGASDALLDSDLAFLDSDAGRHFTDVWIRAVDMAFDQATEEWARRAGTDTP